MSKTSVNKTLEITPEEYARLRYIKDVGDRRADALISDGIKSVYDLLTYFPVRYIDRKNAGSVRDIIATYNNFYSSNNNYYFDFANLYSQKPQNTSSTISNTVEKYQLFTEKNTPTFSKKVELLKTAKRFEFTKEILNKKSFFATLKQEVNILGRVVGAELINYSYRKKRLVLTMRDFTGCIFEILFFQYADSYYKKYKKGDVLIVSGRPEIKFDKLQFIHPTEILILNEGDEHNPSVLDNITPIYSLKKGMKNARINNSLLKSIIHNAFDKYEKYIEELPDSLSRDIREQFVMKYEDNGSKKEIILPTLKDALYSLHFPKNTLDAEWALYRMKIEELLVYQLAIKIKNIKDVKNESGIIIKEKSKSARKLFDKLPFALSPDQRAVLWDFAKDFASGKPMTRLLQGDVGSGKTIVSILTMLMVIDAGYQVVMLAPTEILAEQHFHTISNLLNDFDNVHIAQLTGGMRKKAKAELCEKLLSGEANLIIGTHALFQKDIKYKNLGLIVIDEQHRFGVKQRGDLIKLAEESMDNNYVPHVLYMSATPIPRTLTMSLYGDLKVSVIKTMPKNRLPIKTKIVFENQRNNMFNFINNEIIKGRQAYIVYPLIEKSDKLELKSAIEHHRIIQNQIFPHLKCGLVHGQMAWNEKEEVMNKFLNKEFDILVATTVIEVGIDVPNASVMVIENAERFGLSQLHQLRGRVGRGNEQSYCFLMTQDNFKYQLSKKQDDDEQINAVIRLKTMQGTNDGFEIAEVDAEIRGSGDLYGTAQAGFLKQFNFSNIQRDVDALSQAYTIADQIIESDENLSQENHKVLKEKILKKLEVYKIA